MTQVASNSIGDDLMTGAAEMARFLFRDDSPKSIRRVRHLIRTAKPEHRLPSFKIGGGDAARRSTWRRILEEREAVALKQISG